MEEKYKLRRTIVAKLLEERGTCQRCGQARSQDIHELKSRARGGSILDIENLVAICRPCHNWITEHPVEAAQQGWLKCSWQ
jgi:5-methylcytosine-specific restriction protein A